MNSNKSFILDLLPKYLIEYPAGLEKSVLRRLKTYSKYGRYSVLLVPRFDPNFSDSVSSLRERSEISDLTYVENLYLNLAEMSGGGAAPDTKIHGDNLLDGLNAVDDATDPKIKRLYRNNFYWGWSKNLGHGVFVVDKYDSGKRVLRLIYKNGQLISLDYIDHFTNAVIKKDYIFLGKTYLSQFFDINGKTEFYYYSNKGSWIIFKNESEMIYFWLKNYVLKKYNSNILISEYGFHCNQLSKIEHENPGFNVIYTLHNNHHQAPYRRHSLVKNELKSFFNKIDQFKAVVVLTQKQKEDIEAEFDAKNLYVIPHSSTGIKIKEARNQRVKGLIVAVGRYVEQKGFSDAIEAFKIIHERFAWARLKIFGKGELSDLYNQLIRDAGLSGVAEVAGFSKDVSEVYSKAEVALFPSKYEGQSLSLMECMMSGCVPVAYPFSYGAEEVIKNDINGLLTDQPDPRLLADKVNLLLGDRCRLIELSNNAKMITHEFSEARLYKDWSDLFELLS